MRNEIRCCKDCEDRHRSCHATCEEYKRERAKLDAAKHKIKQQHLVDSYLDNALSDAYGRKDKKRILHDRYKKKGRD